ncbi:MAG: glycosyltransferase family 25 protein [Chloroflexi bacterium]|nr:glycosyltransferase family 25 protein [Chloroflexota bacterium]
MQLPAYVINLDSRPDRWASISENLQQVGADAERISAIDADLLGDVATWRIDRGAAACTFSHGKALRRFLETDRPAALILEDDTELASDTGLLLRDKDWWPARTQAIQLHEQIGRPGRLRGVSGRTPSGRDLRRAEHWAGCAAAYLIDREGASAALSVIEDPPHPIDHILFDLRESRTARCFRPVQIVPAMAQQRYGVEDSDLENWRREARAKRDAVSRLRRLYRNLRRMPYGARLGGLSALGKVHSMEVSYSDG